MLSVRDIVKSYEGKPLLTGISFELSRGEIICLLGSSGSGKSTLLRVIAGLEEAESGAVLWEGLDITAIPPHKRGFGLMFQDYALFPHRDVYDNIAFGPRMQKQSEAEIKTLVREQLRAIRMEAFATRRVTELSGGEQQRVALARALATNPRLLMLDEPLGALDHSLREELTNELRQTLRDSHKPVIYVTHDRQEAFGLADRLLVLHEGRIVQEGSPQDLFEKPVNAWVASFLGLGNLLSKAQLPHLPENNLECDQCGYLLRAHDAIIGEPALPTAFVFEGVIADCVYMGERYQMILHTPQEARLSIEMPRACALGEKIKVYWRAEDVQCLKN